MALRVVIGGRELDQFLADKDAVAKELEEIVRQRVAALGLEVISVGIRDVILPGDMKDLMNKVTEAKKAAEANLIVRREETAAMRSQANTAKVLEGKPYQYHHPPTSGPPSPDLWAARGALVSLPAVSPGAMAAIRRSTSVK